MSAAVFYTYLWLREDGTPYYVGKGTRRRAFRAGSPPRSRIILQEWDSEADALRAEIFLIAFYGRVSDGGILRNLTQGGEGASGYIHSAHARATLRTLAIGRRQSAEARRKMSAWAKGRQKSAETRSRMSESHCGIERGRYKARVRKAIPHGTYSGYQYHKCRCDMCKAARSEVVRARTFQKNLTVCGTLVP